MQPMILKDGSETKDSRMTRIFEPGSNDNAFRIQAVVPQKPRSYTHRLDTILDQGQEGSCVGHGYAHLQLCRPMVYPGIDHTVATYNYWLMQQEDMWPGGAYPGASPRYEGTSMKAGAKVMIKLGYYKEYRHAKNFQELLLGLSRYPAVIGTNWYEGMLNTDKAGYIHPTGSVLGGHCTLLMAQNLAKKRITGANSWGRDNFGMDGFYYLTFDEAEQILFGDRDAEAIFMIR